MSFAHWMIYIGNFKISSTVVTSWIIMAILIIGAYLVTRNLKPVPTTKRQIILEYVVVTLDKMVKETMGETAVKRMPYMVPYIGSLFLFFTTSNLIPLIGIRSATPDLDTTLAWALMTLALMYYGGIKQNGIGHFKELFEPTPIMFPIHFIGEFARPISLSFRPFGNILGGTVIMSLVYQFLGWITENIGLSIPIGQLIIPVPLHLYFDLFAGVLQAYIFIMLTMVFVGGAAGGEAE